MPLDAGDKQQRLLGNGAAEMQPVGAAGAAAPGGGDTLVGSIRSMMERKEIGTLRDLGGAAGLLRAFGVTVEAGPDSVKVEENRQRYGRNELPPLEEITYCKFLKEALQDKMMQLLIVLAVIAIIIAMLVPERGEDDVHYEKAWVEGGMILIAVTIVIAVTTVNDYLKELKFQQLDAENCKQAFKVVRDGIVQEVDVKELVCGDIVEYGDGTVMPVDGLYLTGDGIKIDESACTGENDEKKKDTDHDPFLISGTNVISASPGTRMLCIAVGEQSFSGALEMASRCPPQPTPLQEKLDDLADKVGKVGIVVALVLFVTVSAIVLIKWGTGGQKPEGSDFVGYAIIAVSIVVVAVPEGLPLSVTIALAYSMGAMMKDNCLVRSLSACETMGAATNICSDKTGTLTQNIMHSERLFIGMEDVRPESREAAGAVRVFLDAVSLCSTAARRPPDPQKNEGPGMVWTGDKTEQGLLRWAVDVGDGYEAIRRRPGQTKHVYPFDSKKKSMTVLVRDQAGEVVQYSKGASEIILHHSTHYLDSGGGAHPLGDGERQRLLDVIQSYARDELRTIGVATVPRALPAGAAFPEDDPLAVNLCWVGVAGILDPVRPEVPSAVALCQKAGVAVRMCTGDNIETASAIARSCGILKSGGGADAGVAMLGEDFRRLFATDKQRFNAVLEQLCVLARCSPTDKQLLVGSLMLLGHVVAVTGDGTNDAPALALADVGFAMNDGTQVAKRSSKIVLLDNNFVSVVKACRWGRNVNDNIRKFLQFQFTVNVALLIITFIGAVSDAGRTDGHGEAPLAAIHLLWCNLIMDTMAALALSTERPHEGLMDRLPTYRSAPLLSRRMWRFIGVGSLYQLIVVLVLLYSGKGLFQIEDPRDFPDSYWGSNGTNMTDDELDAARLDPIEDADTMHRTVIFNTFVYMQVFNWFNARKLYDEWNIFEGLGRSPIFLPIVVVTAGVQAFTVEVAQDFVETRSIGAGRWCACLLIAVMVWPLGLLIRCVPINRQFGYDEPIPPIEPPSDGKREMIEEVQARSKAVAVTGKELTRQPSGKSFGAAVLERQSSAVAEAQDSGLRRQTSLARMARGPRGSIKGRPPSGFGSGLSGHSDPQRGPAAGEPTVPHISHFLGGVAAPSGDAAA